MIIVIAKKERTGGGLQSNLSLNEGNTGKEEG